MENEPTKSLENFVAFLGFWQSRFYDDGGELHCNIYPKDLKT